MWWSASIAPTATWRRAGRGPIRQKSRYRATHIWMRNSLDWTTSKRRRFSDILVTALSPIRRGPGSHQYRVKLKRRGPAVKHPPGFFVPQPLPDGRGSDQSHDRKGVVFFWWISCKLQTRMGSRNRAAEGVAARLRD